MVSHGIFPAQQLQQRAGVSQFRRGGQRLRGVFQRQACLSSRRGLQRFFGGRHFAAAAPQHPCGKGDGRHGNKLAHAGKTDVEAQGYVVHGAKRHMADGVAGKRASQYIRGVRITPDCDNACVTVGNGLQLRRAGDGDNNERTARKLPRRTARAPSRCVSPTASAIGARKIPFCTT